MSNPTPADFKAKLQKLGQMVREGWAKRHPTPKKNIDIVKKVVRAQWEQEQQNGQSRRGKNSGTGASRI